MTIFDIAGLILFLILMALFVWITGRRVVTNYQMALLTLVPPLTPFFNTLTILHASHDILDGDDFFSFIHIVIGILFTLFFSFRGVKAPHIVPRTIGLVWGGVCTVWLMVMILILLDKLLWHYPFYHQTKTDHMGIGALLIMLAMGMWIATTWRCWGRDNHILQISRIQQNLCPACGYSLHGLLVDAPCPECGQDRLKLDDPPASQPPPSI